ncbi:MAG: acetyltransferase family [Deltaproteobacteria bacterium]|nr:acetyltransferase family [Deltaproteobacteria bacterium]
MEIIELDRSRLPEIEALWKELNAHHAQRSSNFKQYFDTLTFQDRIKQLLYKEDLSLFVGSDAGVCVGYCIVTAERNKGEVDSIYVRASHRGQRIGHELMSRAMEWLRTKECTEIVIYVAEGNEQALSFYEKYGFSRRFTVMGKRKT